MSQVVHSEPAPPTTVEPTGLEALIQTYFTGQQSTGPGPRDRDRGSDKCEETGRM